MICKPCADAADHGAGRDAHCRDETCPCQHRSIRRPARRPLVHSGSMVAMELPALRDAPKRSRAGAVTVDIEPTGGVL